MQLIQQNLEDYRKEANRLKQASQNVPTDPQTERLINESIDRIDLLMLRSQQGTQMIEVSFHKICPPKYMQQEKVRQIIYNTNSKYF